MAHYEIKQLKPYQQITINEGCLMPLGEWETKGKTPLGKGWRNKEYDKTGGTHARWIDNGWNIGYRIPPGEFVIDLDPRNYEEGVDVEGAVADLFDMFDFDELLETLPVVKTGGGGYHIYCKLGDDVDKGTYERIGAKVQGLKGVDVKKHGGYVVAAGSRHPETGDSYRWVDLDMLDYTPVDALNVLLDRILKEPGDGDGDGDGGDGDGGGDFDSDYGTLSSSVLAEHFLDHLDVKKYGNNEDWLRIAMACHHATGGEGKDTFLDWSLGDSKYEGDNSANETRWDSFNNSKSALTIGTLFDELKKHNLEAFNGAQAFLDFGNLAPGEHATLKDEFKKRLNIDVDQIIDTVNHGANSPIDEIPMSYEDVNAEIEVINKKSHPDALKGCIECISHLKGVYRTLAIDKLVKRSLLTKGSINEQLKIEDTDYSNDLVARYTEDMLIKYFKGGLYLSNEPSGEIYMYTGKYWVLVTKDTLSSLCLLHYRENKVERGDKVPELEMGKQMANSLWIQCSTSKPRIHSADKFDEIGYAPAIMNCKNGEIHIQPNGTHTFEPHNYASYQTTMLNASYRPGVVPKLTNETMEGIFTNYPDGDAIVEHMWEIFGYTTSDAKNIPSFFMFIGPGGDGKSTALKILQCLLSHEQVYSAPESFIMKGGNGNDNHVSENLVGVLAVIIDDTSSDAVLADGQCKRASEVRTMSVNPKGLKGYEAIYKASVFVCGNSYPVIKDLSVGMRRRIFTVPFNREFTTNNEADVNRIYKLKNSEDERSGMLNNMLAGLVRLRKRGNFNPPRSCKEAKADFLNSSNNSARFVNEYIRITSNKENKAGKLADIYATYSAWCLDEGVKSKNKVNFSKDLRGLGLTIKKLTAGTRYVIGAQLKPGKVLIDDF